MPDTVSQQQSIKNKQIEDNNIHLADRPVASHNITLGGTQTPD